MRVFTRDDVLTGSLDAGHCYSGQYAGQLDAGLATLHVNLCCNPLVCCMSMPAICRFLAADMRDIDTTG